MAAHIGRDAGMQYIYMGNVPGESNTTYCPNCREALIKRSALSMVSNKIKDGHCPSCGNPIEGVLSFS